MWFVWLVCCVCLVENVLLGCLVKQLAESCLVWIVWVGVGEFQFKDQVVKVQIKRLGLDGLGVAQQEPGDIKVLVGIVGWAAGVQEVADVINQAHHQCG